MSWCPGGDSLDEDIFDAFTEFIAQLLHRGEQLAERFDVPASCVKAIHRLDPAVSMKDLGQQLHCDPSFVTMIADALEARGLATRQPNPSDRRIKNLVLTGHGQEVKAALQRDLLKLLPWAHALDRGERELLLGMIRKMSRSMSAAPEQHPAAHHEGEVSDTAGPVLAARPQPAGGR